MPGQLLLESLCGKVVIVFSAHCDDAPLGCGGLLLRLQALGDQCKRLGVVFSGASDVVRLQEENAAMRFFGVEMYRAYDYADTCLPNHWHEIKQKLLEIRESVKPNQIGLILCPRMEDRHQDHRTIAENVWRVFRQHLILEYEIHKYEGDLGTPNFYVKVSDEYAKMKVDGLLMSYPSRSCHHWWNADNFLSLMRVRGVEANCQFAEGLYARKLIV